RDTTRFRIATMDCAAEESEIRRALDPIAGIRHLRFDLGQRLLDLSGTPGAIDQAAAAMRRIGFDPQPFATAAVPGATPAKVADGPGPVPFGTGLWRLRWPRCCSPWVPKPWASLLPTCCPGASRRWR
ncbi:MAG: heavy-metal-associated domain-containing protein, partial [Ideonella sp.]|nr:heavy-metal-associated domain-containing protein [Ideonella sp.]